jgi:hypothetical protein
MGEKSSSSSELELVFAEIRPRPAVPGKTSFSPNIGSGPKADSETIVVAVPQHSKLELVPFESREMDLMLLLGEDMLDSVSHASAGLFDSDGRRVPPLASRCEAGV